MYNRGKSIFVNMITIKHLRAQMDRKKYVNKKVTVLAPQYTPQPLCPCKT